MGDLPYRWRGNVIKYWQRDSRGMWQAHHCYWQPGLWPFTDRELKRLLLLRWEISTGRIDEHRTTEPWTPRAVRGVCPPDQR